MLGAIAGDIIGSIYERHNTTRYDFELFTNHSTFTDDTVMTVAMMDHILSRADLADTIRKWYSRYPRKGYGPGFRAWIGGHAKGMSRGNGAAMRTSPGAWLPYPWEEMIENVVRCARVTHDSPDGVAGSRAVAITIRHLRDGFGAKYVRNTVEGTADGYERLRWPPKIKQPGGLARESVPVALAAALNSKNFEDAIRKAVSVGGDSDTIASIAGAVAEAIYGRLPDEILYEIRDRLPSDLMNVVDDFYYNWVDPDIAYPRTHRKGNESVSGLQMAPPYDPIYRRGFAFGIIGGKRKGGF
jgi:ADP-ribosylglycohydrolase